MESQSVALDWSFEVSFEVESWSGVMEGVMAWSHSGASEWSFGVSFVVEVWSRVMERVLE